MTAPMGPEKERRWKAGLLGKNFQYCIPAMPKLEWSHAGNLIALVLYSNLHGFTVTPGIEDSERKPGITSELPAYTYSSYSYTGYSDSFFPPDQASLL